MMRVRLASAAAVALLLACSRTSAPVQQQPQQPVSAVVVPTNPNQRFNDSVVQAYLARLGTRQTDSAAKVFQNVQLTNLQGTPARTFLSIMNGGYARALGVSCEHCHDLTDFASDAKRPKLAAREMAVMHRMINQELGKIQHIRTPATQNRAINCATCHRGVAIPR